MLYIMIHKSCLKQLGFSWRMQTRWRRGSRNYRNNGMKSIGCYLWLYLSSFWKWPFSSEPVPVVCHFISCNTTHSVVHYAFESRLVMCVLMKNSEGQGVYIELWIGSEKFTLEGGCNTSVSVVEVREHAS